MSKDFSIVNHTQWAKDNLANDLRGELSVLEMPDLVKAYQEALNIIESTDSHSSC